MQSSYYPIFTITLTSVRHFIRSHISCIHTGLTRLYPALFSNYHNLPLTVSSNTSPSSCSVTTFVLFVSSFWADGSPADPDFLWLVSSIPLSPVVLSVAFAFWLSYQQPHSPLLPHCPQIHLYHSYCIEWIFLCAFSDVLSCICNRNITRRRDLNMCPLLNGGLYLPYFQIQEDRMDIKIYTVI